MKKLVLLLLAGSILVATGCKKTGPQGPQGIPGKNGTNGTNGLDGNANVVGSDPFTVGAGDWTLNTTAHWYSVTYSSPSITTDIVDRGIIEMFKSYATNDWTNLPEITGQTSTVFDFTDGQFTIYVQNADGTTPAPPGNQVFRMVIISASQKQSHPNTNWKNINEALAAINSVSAPAANQ